MRLGLIQAIGKRYGLSVLFSFVLIAVPWEIIRGDPFTDLQNYVDRIERLRVLGSQWHAWEGSIASLLTFEYLWFQLLVLAVRNDIEATGFLKGITALSGFLTHGYLRQYLGSALALAVLINPIVIDLLSSQIRSALAFALFLMCVRASKRAFSNPWRLPVLLVLPLIHTSLLLVMVVYSMSVFLAKAVWLSDSLRSGAALLIAVSLAGVVYWFAPDAALAFGDRRDLAGAPMKSLAYLAFWLFWVVVLVVFGHPKEPDEWAYFFVIIICVAGSLLDVLGFGGFRFVALSLPIVFSTLRCLSGMGRSILQFMLPIVTATLFVYWIL